MEEFNDQVSSPVLSKTGEALAILEQQAKEDVSNCELAVDKALKHFSCGLQFIEVRVNGVLADGTSFRVVKVKTK